MRHRSARIACALIVIALVVLPAPSPARADSIAPEKVAPALRARMQADPLALLPVIVEMRHPLAPFIRPANVGRATEALDLLRAYGVAVGALALVNGAAGFANATGIEALSLVPTVAYIHHDATVGPRRAAAPPASLPVGQLGAAFPRAVNADQVWQQGTTGRGITVAVLDSGVEPNPDLTEPTNRILASVDLVGDSSSSTSPTPLDATTSTTSADATTSASPALAPERDPGGHGTHVAGIMAGNGTQSAGEFVGIAPQAGIVDVRVLNRTGGGRISSVVRGIEWVLAHRSAYGIRVINLSFGAPISTSYRTDPLSAAVEIAWRSGLVVVAASGNHGPERDTVVTPGIDPYVITVGATDDLGTAGRGDDGLAWFSAWGSADSNVKPDLVAPGRRIISTRVPGSTLDTLYADRVVMARNGSTYFRLSGTSMATGVVSGAVALLLERRPDLTPDQVKAILVGTTQLYGQESGIALPDPIADGNGLLDAFAAATSDSASGGGTLASAEGAIATANRGLRPADGFARTLYPVLYGTPLRWKEPTLEGLIWGPLTWESVAWDSVAWDSVAWDSVAWDSVAWDSVAWDSVAWDSVAWDSVAWDSVAWDAFDLD